MTSKSDQLPAFDSFRCNCIHLESLKIKKAPFSERGETEEYSVSSRLSKLPEIKARAGFEQKMAAAFAMELERETLLRNRSWLKKHPKIFLPNLITDLKKDLL